MTTPQPPHPPSGPWQQYGHQQPPQWAPPAAPPPPAPAPKAKKKWPWIVGGVVLLLVIVSVANGGNTQPQAVPASPTWSQAPAAAPPAQPQPAEPVAPAAAPGPQTSFGDGTWVVGEDIVPGTYKSPGAQEGMFELCSVTTHSDDTADSSKTLDWKTANAGEPVRLKLEGKVKSVKASGCEDFVKVG